MIRVLLLAVVFSLGCMRAAGAGQVAERGPISMNFGQIPVVQLVALVYGDMLGENFVLHPALASSEQVVTVRLETGMDKPKLRKFIASFLDSVGIVAEQRGAYVLVRPVAERGKRADDEVFFYRPKHRSVSYIMDLCSGLFTSGRFSVQRAVAGVTGQLSAVADPAAPRPVDNGSNAYSLQSRAELDAFVFSGPAKEVELLGKLLPQVDVPVGEVIVKAVLYEVVKGKTDGTAVSVALSVLGGRLGVSLGDSARLGNAVTFKSADFEAAFSALASDTRFKAISTPRLRVRSGAQAKLTVGQDVPTVGALSYPQNGAAPVQSIEYKSAGVIFGITPEVRDSVIDVHLDQQVSDFARTETGVNNSPTLTKRSLSTDVTLADGELVVLGGLTQDRNTGSRSGLSFLPRWLDTSSSSEGSTEILLMLQVDRVVRTE